MNEETPNNIFNVSSRITKEYNIGDLVALYGDRDPTPIGLVVDKKVDIMSELELMGCSYGFVYKVLFCGDAEADERWIFADMLTSVFFTRDK